jgi:AraC-like DNA-binding protein
MAETLLNIYAIILLMTLVQSLLFSLILIVRGITQNIKSDFLLSLLILIMGLSTIPHLFGWMGISVLWNDLTFYPWNGFELAVLPTLFLFLQSRLNTQLQFSWKDLKHYWLYITYVIYHFAVAVQGKEFAKWWWFEVNNRYNIDALFSFLNVSLFAFYMWRFSKIYKDYQSWSANRYSNLPLLSIAWIRNFIVAYFFFIAIDVGLTIMKLTIGAQYDKMWWAYIANLGLTYYISIYGLNKKPFTGLDFEIPQQIQVESEQVENVEKQPFSQEEIDHWRLTLRKHFETTKPYLNPELRLSELALHFNINISSLSTLINLCFDQNFNDLINTYRIEAFIQKVNEGGLKHFTLMSLAYDSGFNSKTTFNRAFKKHTSISPTEFLKKEQQSP